MSYLKIKMINLTNSLLNTQMFVEEIIQVFLSYFFIKVRKKKEIINMRI